MEQTNSLLKETKRECDNLTVMQIDNEPSAKQHINKEFIDMNNEYVNFEYMMISQDFYQRYKMATRSDLELKAAFN